MTTNTKKWVEIAFDRNEEELMSVRGLISQNTLTQILENTYTNQFFRLEKVHWLSEEEEPLTNKPFLKYYIYGHNSDLIGLAGASYYRTQDVREISPLVPQYDNIYDNAKFQESLFNTL